MDQLTEKPVLIIEDDPAIQALLNGVLRSAGCRTITRTTGRAGLDAALSEDCGLVILDLVLPEMDGMTVLRCLRGVSNVPVLVLSGRRADVDKARLLTAGADDYLVKPFSRIELLARMHALVRRAAITTAPVEVTSTISCEGIVLDLSARVATVDGEPTELSRIEFDFLATLLRSPGRAVPYKELLREAWQDLSGLGTDRTKFTAMRLRRKVGPVLGAHLEPVRGYGYRWRAGEGAVAAG
jgi:DNA-binding response OmpR family regulator